MFRGGRSKSPIGVRFPRVRGDVPRRSMILTTLSKFSPRARGCSYRIPVRKFRVRVFPACAGMFLLFSQARQYDPRFSPRARGCSAEAAALEAAAEVFPACAGMFPRIERNPIITAGFPRVRGDVPCAAAVVGCLLVVFPACAGMFRLSSMLRIWVMSFPRVRGDVPRKRTCPPPTNPFSPRARGCSCD